jgi:hypothetical protein
MRVYGKDAEAIKQGQQFTAVVHNVEGRTVVELVPVEKVYS